MVLFVFCRFSCVLRVCFCFVEGAFLRGMLMVFCWFSWVSLSRVCFFSKRFF